MTKSHNVPLTDDDLLRIIAGLNMVASQLGHGQAQQGLAAIAEVRAKSAPLEVLAGKLTAFLPKPDAPKEHDGPPAADPKAPGSRKDRRAAASAGRK